FQFRYYDSHVGRFLQEDPDSGKVNNPITFVSKYIYANNNPTSYIDPTGRASELPALYGNYCGPYANGDGWSKKPKNSTDRVCEVHDKKYTDAENFESKWSDSNNFFAPELEFAEETYHYIYHRALADARMIVSLGLDSNRWKDSHGNFSFQQLIVSQGIAGYFIAKYVLPSPVDAALFTVDKGFPFERYYSRSLYRLTGIKINFKVRL
ncbi:MAG: RHS repeat-associated core domain-containing protein, partial [Bacteriovoracia bacterium]